MKINSDQILEIQDSITTSGEIAPGEVVIKSAGSARIEVKDNKIKLIADQVTIDSSSGLRLPLKVNDTGEEDEEVEDPEDEIEEESAETGEERGEAHCKEEDEPAQVSEAESTPLQTKDFLKNSGFYDEIVRLRERMNQDPLDTEPSSRQQRRDDSFSKALGTLSKYAHLLDEDRYGEKEPVKPADHIDMRGMDFRDVKHYSNSSVGNFWRAGADDKPLETWDYSWRRKQLDQLNKAVEKYADDVSNFDGDVLKRQAYINKVKKHIMHGKQAQMITRGITESEIQANAVVNWPKPKPVPKPEKPLKDHGPKVTEAHDQKEGSKISGLRAWPKQLLKKFSTRMGATQLLKNGAKMLHTVASKLEESNDGRQTRQP